MKCKQCESLGLKSAVHDHGGYSTLLGYIPYYDEDGSYHNHDPNVNTTSLSCSNGHNWTVKLYNKCICGWEGGGTKPE